MIPGPTVADGDVERLRIGTLSLSALHHVIARHLATPLARPTLLRVHAASGGNPLFAIELARHLLDRGIAAAPGEPLPMPERLGALLHTRLSRLPARARRALAAVALVSDPRIELLETAFGDLAAEVELARERGILEVRDGRLRFAHPLLADAILAMSTDDERRALHGTLAEVVEDEIAAARHRALAAREPDAAVAGMLDRAARHATDRGASEQAVELLQLAVRLSDPDDRDRFRRRIDLAAAIHRAGDTPAAKVMLDETLAAVPTGPDRALALELRAHLDWVAGSAEMARRRCQEALDHVGDDQALRARVLVTLARLAVGGEAARVYAAEAMSLVDVMPAPDPVLAGEALVAWAGCEIERGAAIPWPLVERGLALEAIRPPVEVADRMSAALASWLKYAGDFEGARTWFERVRRAAIDEGDEASLPYALSHLPQLELWCGDLVAAEARASEHLDVAIRTGQTTERLTAIYSLASIDAHAGRLDDARRRIADALPEAERTDEWNVYQLLSVLGFVELSVGDAEAAIPSLVRAVDLWEGMGMAGASIAHENLVEALLLRGRTEEARRVVGSLEARAVLPNQPMALAGALRSRALLFAADGDLASARAHAAGSIEAAQSPPIPFNLGRSHLVAGRIARRAGARRDARDALERARDTFSAMGAEAWQSLAERELGRIPIRRASGTTLTDGEQRVADLVAAGCSNAEVARRLFVTPKTVEANLTRIYAKLGVGSRTQLAARLRDGDTRVAEAEL